MKTTFGAGRRVLGCVVALLTLAGMTPARAHVAPLSDEQLVRAARQVVVATVTGRTARWNSQHNLILTDYALAVETVLRGDAGRELTVTVAGGTLDGETQESCMTVQLEIGRRYLLFVNDPARPTFSAFTGAQEGVFVEVPAALPGADSTVGGGGGALRALRDGSPPEFRAFVTRVRSFIAEVESRPAPPAAGPVVHDPPLPSKRYGSDSGLDAGPASGVIGRGGIVPAALVHPDGPAPPVAPVVQHLDSSHAVYQGTRSGGLDYSVSRAPARYIVWNQLPPSFAPWSPNDQYMMARWNSYGDIHRVSGAPTGNWAWGNNRYDMTGWPSSQDMMNNFGRAWGANELAVCWSRWFGDGPIVESDISMNPAFGWTLDDITGTDPDDGRWSYPQSVLHELGHSWGLAHPWETQDVWWDSVMNYAPKDYRFPWLMADDTNAIRSAYPGIAIHDGMVKLWETFDAMATWNAGYYGTVPISPTVRQLDSFTFQQGFTVENIGTDNLLNPQVEVYLTPRRLDWSGNVYLQTLSYSATIGTYGIWYLDAGSIYIPYYTPPGDYYVAFWLRDNTEPNTYNNGTWTVKPATIKVLSYWWSIYPELYWQSQAVTLGPNGQYDFYFDSDGAQRVDLSTCPADGGAASFDTILEVYDPVNNLVGFSDDACGLQSRLSVDASVAGTYHVALRGYSGASGSVTMTYRKRSFATETLQLSVSQNPALGWIVLDMAGELGPFDVERATLPDFSDATRLATGTDAFQVIDPDQADGVSYFYRAR